mmetsp:Transcript_12014/g.13477  ORF Transcript_12014/g.13477 Transcript_12014/m.13477 type:complete len:342 (+) Transcript_12014:65-1090(+)
MTMTTTKVTTMFLFQVVFLFTLCGMSSVVSQSPLSSLAAAEEEVVQVVVGARTGTELIVESTTGIVVALQDDLPLDVTIDADYDADEDSDAVKYDKNKNTDYAFMVNDDGAGEVSPFMISSSKSFPIASTSASASMLRGTTTTTTTTAAGGNKALFSSFLSPIPPFHPHHSGSVQYSSVMNNGHISYRRDVNAPCDDGMLIFTVGVAAKELPYEYDLYNEAYLYSDNAGLCILYPTYVGYQLSPTPWWTVGVDPTTVIFTNLRLDPSSMHRVSSRQLPTIQNPTTDGIDPEKLGDYVIMAKHDFYNIDYYKQLKAYINSWKTTTTTSTMSTQKDTTSTSNN